MIGGIVNRRNIKGYSSGVCLKCDPPKMYSSLATHFRFFEDHKPLPVEIMPPVDIDNHIQPPNDDNYEDIHDNNWLDMDIPNNEELLFPQEPIHYNNHLYYTGKLPDSLKLYHQTIPDSECRQNISTLNRELNPLERSPMYYYNQCDFFKEAFGINDINVLSEGTFECFYNAVKQQDDGLSNNQKFQKSLYAFMDSSSVSSREKKELIDLLRTREDLSFLPATVSVYRRNYQKHVVKTLPQFSTNTYAYPPNWNTNSFPKPLKPCQDLSFDFLNSLIIQISDPRIWAFSNRENVHYYPFESTVNYSDGSTERVVTCSMNGEYAKRMKARAMLLPGAHESDIVGGVGIYADKVSLAAFSKQSLIPSFGILNFYSHNINKKNMGKIRLGYLSDFQNKSKKIFYLIGKHGSAGLLDTIQSKGRRRDSMVAYKHEVQHIFFKRICDDILYSWHVGIEVFIPGLGKRVVRFYLDSILADAPQNRDYLGMLSPNAKHGCTNCCAIPKLTSDIYCPTVHTIRNFLKQIEMMKLRQSFNEKKEKKLPTTEEEKQADEFCQKWAFAPSRCLPGFTYAPIPTETPYATAEIAVPDIFHDFYAGIFQCIVITSLRLIEALAKIKNPTDVKAISKIDERTCKDMVPRNNQIPELEHLEWTTYNDGLGTIFLKETGEHTGATGKAGQMRSVWSLNQLIMILMAIGPWGEIIPNSEHKSCIIKSQIIDRNGNIIEPEESIEIKNPTQLICNSILSSISYLYEMKRQIWIRKFIELNTIRVRSMQIWGILLYQTMVSLSRYNQTETNVELGMSKWHGPSHTTELPWNNGNFNSLECGSMESFHREAVTSIYWKTSGREDTKLEEMAIRNQESMVQIHDEIRRLIHSSKDIEDFKLKINERDIVSETPINVCFKVSGSARSKIWNGGNNDLIKYMHNKAIIGFENRMNNIIPQQYRVNITISIITGLKYIGNNTSLYSNGILYSAPKINEKTDSIYSAISFSYDDEIRIGWVIAMVKISNDLIINDNNNNSNYILHVAIMEESLEIDIPIYWPFRRLKFIDNVIENIICINSNELIDHLFLYPDFSVSESSLSDTTLNVIERYWLLPREFFERKNVIESPMYCESQFADTVEHAKIYLHQNQAHGVNMDVTGFEEYPIVGRIFTQNE